MKPTVTNINIAEVPLTELMKAFDQELPVSTDGNLCRYNAPYRVDDKASLIINTETNQWRDIETNSHGNIYDLAYEMIGSHNKSELNLFLTSKLNNMAKKSKETADVQKETPVESKKKAKKTEPAAAAPASEQSEEKKEKRAPLITVNGDKVSHVHVFKSDRSENWLVAAKVNDVPLKPQVISKEHLDQFMNKELSAEHMMYLYFPTKMMPKLSSEDWKLPQSVMTPEGEKTVHKFNVYKETDPSNAYAGQYRFYAQIGDMKMSESASKFELNNYFDKTMPLKEMVAMKFGERLHMASHYDMYKLPNNSGISEKDIRLTKNKQTNHYEISVKLPNGERTPAKELSFDDRKSFFEYKTASKENLAVKYLNADIYKGLSAPKKEQTKQQSLAL